MTPRRSPLPSGDPLPRDGGFTMLEIIVTIGVAGILMAVAVSGWQGWAVTEGSSTCVLFDAADDSWEVFRGRCDSSTKLRIEGPVRADDSLDLASPSFIVTTESTSTGVTFSPRGTATPGSVTLRRDGSDTVVTIRVEGLTGRVTEG